MFRSHPISGAFALVACLFSFFAVSAGTVHAVEPPPDARILSAAPFVYQGDREIFSRMSVEPSDARIFRPQQPLRSAGEPHLNERLKRQSMI
ncbi:hypothetical protein AWB74_00494 [Caballeronia arvi]|uniref:Uncharacterized protein n=1 Tax=Caballeronia arvi TaxID=1777135 RepID=A0A158F8J4_9BURK|nr:hypothetical protein [Caballeronia arvi]SAL16051.1 hypothetical protein AWB74_00494 [Caballeronia arvi]